jgi:hypothetical protein
MIYVDSRVYWSNYAKGTEPIINPEIIFNPLFLLAKATH